MKMLLNQLFRGLTLYIKGQMYIELQIQLSPDIKAVSLFFSLHHF